jgi:hypothetical protein
MGHITVNQDSLKPRREFKRHQIQPGHNILRILPAFGDEANHNNYPYKRWTLAWLIDPATNKRRPFALPPYEKNNADPITGYTKALSEKIDSVKKNAIDKMIEKGISKEKAEETVREKLADANKLVWEMRPKTGYYYNACNKAGEIGILEIKKTAHDALKAEMYQYIKDYSQDPTSLCAEVDDSGIWFDIERIGEKGDKDTKYKVSKYQKKFKNERGLLQFEDDRDALPEHIAQNYSSLGYDIYNLYQAKTHDELYVILMYNLRSIVEMVPMARIEGFDPSLFNFDAIITTDEEPEVVKEKPIIKGKAPVKLALQDPEDDLEVDIAIEAKAAPKPVNKPQPSTDDILAMAEDFLNS